MKKLILSSLLITTAIGASIPLVSCSKTITNEPIAPSEWFSMSDKDAQNYYKGYWQDYRYWFVRGMTIEKIPGTTAGTIAETKMTIVREPGIVDIHKVKIDTPNYCQIVDQWNKVVDGWIAYKNFHFGAK